jgi:hypothetical protein
VIDEGCQALYKDPSDRAGSCVPVTLHCLVPCKVKDGLAFPQCIRVAVFVNYSKENIGFLEGRKILGLS